MKKILFALLAAAIIIACGQTETKSNNSSAAKAKKTANVTPPKIDGKKIYKQYCVTCHGLYGDMGASGAANLAESKLNLEERIAVITNGRNTMAAFKALLNEDKIKAVAKYTEELTKKD